MRPTTMLAAALALTTAATAQAQAPGAPYPAPGMGMQRPPLPQPPRMNVPGPRWGSRVGGRWWGGANAPGGYAAYRQPYRGYRLPGYWVAPRFYVGDWNRYGLYAPTGGYNWVRYYDDAVLVDGAGSVADWRGGLDWDAYDRADYADDGHRGSSGVGGAIAGAAVGGIAGNVIAGRGNRLGGTLIGAGVGAAVGYGVDRAAHRDRRGPPPGYGDGYRGEPGGPRDGDWAWHDGGYPLPPGHPPIGPQGPTTWSSADGRTTVTTATSGGYGGAPLIVNGGGYGYGGGVTTVTVQTAPVVTTTTTEIVEDTVTYRPVYRHIVRRVRCAWPPVRHRAAPRPRVMGS